MVMRVHIHVVPHKVVFPSALQPILHSHFCVPLSPLSITRVSRSPHLAHGSLVQLGMLPRALSIFLSISSPFVPLPISAKMSRTTW